MPAVKIISAKSVDEYFERVPPTQRAALSAVRKTVKAAAPEAEEVLSYQMPAFKQGRILLYYAAFSDHCSLFLPSEKVKRAFARELKPFHKSKATYHFTPQKPIPAALLRRIVKARLDEEQAHRGRK